MSNVSLLSIFLYILTVSGVLPWSCPQEGDLVLLDENLLRMAISNPLYVRPHSKAILSRAIGADTSFLSQQLIMDYSLLVGVDATANELIVGIIGGFLFSCISLSVNQYILYSLDWYYTEASSI